MYEGYYENDLKQGYGKYIWSNGSVYEGYFKKDKKQGKGSIRYENGKIAKLEWDQGNVVKKLGTNESVTDIS
jgi:hypothetical protein